MNANRCLALQSSRMCSFYFLISHAYWGTEQNRVMLHDSLYRAALPGCTDFGVRQYFLLFRRKRNKNRYVRCAVPLWETCLMLSCLRVGMNCKFSGYVLKSNYDAKQKQALWLYTLSQFVPFSACISIGSSNICVPIPTMQPAHSLVATPNPKPYAKKKKKVSFKRAASCANSLSLLILFDHFVSIKYIVV